MQISSELISTIGLYAVLLTFPAIPVAIIIGIVLHNTLIKRLDPVLFKRPYFREKELHLYVTWPFSFLKTAGYIMLITCPKAAKWKRFKGFDKSVPVGKPLVVLSYIEVALLTTMILALFLLMVSALVLWLIG
ncbi:hypothetical protein OOT55_09700 [Marinimicrobium sp. C6131]|uniref:hypothetical protein n=1 Tax=Marinimicrobium sp. C6131 TaxID=3022676 RepID=UPI00223E25F3|nr:hypothetical protein [Marinimicrobium sp. C6131]UZJ42927.1 hypothetical protein OOT55_09700 [Marinimicrobium sp. C6131]